MDIASVLNIILPIVFIGVGIALIIFLLELVKTLKTAQKTVNDLGPTLKNVEDITTNIQPTLAKVDPLMDRVQLTIDSVNLEMMRVDEILEDVSEITDAASSATAAVDNITSAPVKAVNSVAERLKTKLGGKGASDESAKLAEQRVAVAQALKEYEQAENSAADTKAETPAPAAAKEQPAAAAAATETATPEPAAQQASAVNDDLKFVPTKEPNKSYVQVEEDGQPVIDPKVIAESPFFTEDIDAK